MDLDPRLDEMGPHRAFGDLQFQRPVGDAIVMSDLPLLLDAQDLVGVDARDRRERRALAGRIPAALDDTVERVNITLPRRVLRRLDEEARAARRDALGLHRQARDGAMNSHQNRTASPVAGAVSSPSHITRRPRTIVPTGQPVTAFPS